MLELGRYRNMLPGMELDRHVPPGRQVRVAFLLAGIGPRPQGLVAEHVGVAAGWEMATELKDDLAV